MTGAQAMLREAAKQLRSRGDSGHARMCDIHAAAIDGFVEIVVAVNYGRIAPIDAGHGEVFAVRVTCGWTLAVWNGRGYIDLPTGQQIDPSSVRKWARLPD